MLELKKICKNYVTSSETVKALRGVDITFRDKEFVSILGPSGCGKTTLLNIVGGLDHYTSGDLIINGRSTRSYKDRDWDVYRNHRVGFIFQSYNLIPHQTILGNVELALTISGIPKAERIERAKEALDRVGLAGQYNKKPNQLSGGQCQRVAIARALVNDPEILLADEPTGALDTVTSVQIMDLIREIADERLVIMVTHNPELAEQYSTRIIRLLDGEVVEDSNPVTAEELAAYEEDRIEQARLAEIAAAENAAQGSAESASEISDGEPQKEAKKAAKPRREKAKMSIFTAFRLSAKNLISKKGRTSMVGFAGSIGIIGIAMVLAFSSGIKGYIKSMQDDMLSGNPIQITETTYDLEVLTGMMTSLSEREEIQKLPGNTYINSIVEYIARMSDRMNSMVIKNDISENYIQYIKEMPSEYYSALLLSYGIDMSNNIYTDYERQGVTSSLSISALTNIYTSVLQSTEYKDYASYVSQIIPSFKQAPNNKEYIANQYDVIGEIADEYDEIMLVLDQNQEISDLLLARLGYYTEDEFFAILDKATSDDNTEGEHYRKYFTNEELLGKTFVWYPNDEIFIPNEMSVGGNTMINPSRPFYYNYNASDDAVEGTTFEFSKPKDGVTLKVTGILYTNDHTTYGCLKSGVYYTEALTKHVLEKNMNSSLSEYLRLDTTNDNKILSMSYNGMNVGVFYDYDFTTYDDYEESVLSGTERKSTRATAFVGSSLGINDIIGSFAGGAGGGGSTGGTGGAGGAGGGANVSLLGSMKTLSLRSVGGNDLANAVSIYPISFESKDLVTNYLDNWNRSIDITLGKGTENELTLKADERGDVTYTDALELVINLINDMIDIVTTALVAFTSVSLVVSTVMIGIITYVSVVERIKEIGVIRSLGGRKKDVSRLFTAETFIIGLLSGLMGIGVTVGLTLIVSAIIKALFGIPNIAFVEPLDAIILILLSIGLTLISGLLPARSAAKKDPVVALRTE